MGRLKYKEIAKQKIKNNRNVVISETYNENNEIIGYTVSEQMVIEEDGKETTMFLKGGLGVLSEEGIANLLEAVKSANEKILSKWD